MIGHLLDEGFHRCAIVSVLPPTRRKAICALILSAAIAVFCPGTVGAENSKSAAASGVEPLSLPARDCTHRATFRHITDLQKVLLAHQQWLDFMALTEGQAPRPPLPHGAIRADLHGAYLQLQDLSGKNLSYASLGETCLRNASLKGAALNYTDLRGADLRHAELERASFVHTKLGGAWFEPNTETIKTVKWIHSATGLDDLTYRETPIALIFLRQMFKTQGLRDQERQITRSINVSQRRSRQSHEGWGGRIEAAFNYIAFERTTEYGLRYGRPLWLLVIAVPVFAIAYAIAMIQPLEKTSGIWMIWNPDRVNRSEGSSEPIRLTSVPRWGAPTSARSLRRVGRVGGFALYFSLLSAFNIGWRELNVGNWITRLQPRQYTLQATGWVRVVSGAQSLLSVYLLALWVLTYFGRPFE